MSYKRDSEECEDMFRKLHEIYEELILIKKELQAISSNLEFKKKEKSQENKIEVFYRSLTSRERQLVNWAISLEKDSDALKTIKKLSLSINSDNAM